MPKGTKPDYVVKARIRGTKENAKVGAAWRNGDGSISIDLNPFVVLKSHTDMDITLFPPDAKETTSK